MKTIEKDIKNLLQENHQFGFGWAMACCNRDKEDAEDVLQTVYLKIIGEKAVFNGNSNFKTWFFGIIRKTAIDLHRKKKIRNTCLSLIYSQEEVVDRDSDPAVQTEKSHQQSRLVKALSLLPKRQQEVLHLVFYQGLTIQEAGEVLKISKGSARKHYERGKSTLRQLMQEWKEEL